MKLGSTLSISLVAAAIAAAPVFAASKKMLQDEDKVLESAKTTLSEAISTAETQVKGKALSARLERWHGQNFYDVRVVNGDQLTDVHVGIDDGKVLSSWSIERARIRKTKYRAAIPENMQQPGNTEASSGQYRQSGD